VPHPSYTDKLEALVMALAHGVDAFQVGYSTPWEVEHDEDDQVWKIRSDDCDMVWEVREGDFTDPAPEVVRAICDRVNVAEKLHQALRTYAGPIEICEDTVAAAYDLLPDDQKKWR